MEYAIDNSRVKYGEIGNKRKLIYLGTIIISHESRECVETVFSNPTSWRFKETRECWIQHWPLYWAAKYLCKSPLAVKYRTFTCNGQFKNWPLMSNLIHCSKVGQLNGNRNCTNTRNPGDYLALIFIGTFKEYLLWQSPCDQSFSILTNELQNNR